MLDIVKSMFTMGIILGFYAIFGMLASQVFRLKYSAGRTLLIGFFVYHGIFQLIAFPLICLKQPLSLLTGCWMAVLATALVWFVLVLRKREKWRFAWKRDYGFLCALTAMILLAAFQYYYVVRIPYHGWDTAFYVGTVHQSVVSNTMYIYNGTTGRPAEVINMRYALSSFYMHEAVWCQLLKIHPILFGKYAIAGMGAILSNVVVYQIAGLFFKEKKKEVYCCLTVCVAVLIHFFYVTIYTASEFLLTRGYEAKAYCANIILPIVFLIAAELWRDAKKRENWFFLFFLTVSCNAISMSSLVTVPVMITVLLAANFVCRRSKEIVTGWLLCILPCILYMGVYLAYTKNIFVIGL